MATKKSSKGKTAAKKSEAKPAAEKSERISAERAAVLVGRVKDPNARAVLEYLTGGSDAG